MSDIFLSYASKDIARAKQLAEALTKLGWVVWWDRTILPGKIFDKVIEAELTATKCVIVLWSSHSVESPWVRAEAEDAMKKGRLIPALLGDVSIPLVFRQFQAASLSDWSGDTDHAGFQQLVRAVTALLAQPDTTATPIPAHPQPTANTEKDADDTSGAQVADNEMEPAVVSGTDPSPQHERTNRRPSQYLSIGSWVLVFLLAGTVAYMNYFPRNQAKPDGPAQESVQPLEQGQPPESGLERAEQEQGGTQLDEPPFEPKQEPPQDAPQVAKKTTPDAIPTRNTPVEPIGNPGTAITSSKVEPEATLPKPRPTEQRNSRKVIETKQHVPTEVVAATTPPKISAEAAAPLTLLTVTWAMPSDDGVAPIARIHEFSTKVSKVMTGVLQDVLNRPVKIEYYYPSQKEHYRWLKEEDGRAESLALCNSKKPDLVVSGFIKGAKYVSSSYGYALTRDPIFSVFDCRTGEMITDSYRIAENVEDGFPYERAIAKVFREFAEQKAALSKY